MTKIWDREQKELGIILNSSYVCRARECDGVRLRVRWQDGKITYPCTRAMSTNDKGEKIIT